ncbi:MAG: site-specific integrase, partial [Actinomycetota bacterium]|nr:site-specific integrase [Actinomycetota bacterium]
MDTPASVTATLPLEVEDFLLWLTTERGRSANTVMAYRRDLTKYVAFLGEHEETPS